MNSSTMAQRAVLMRLSVGMPGKARKDKAMTQEVIAQKNLGGHAGRWVKERFPEWALQPLEKLAGEARQYHDSVTLTFDKGIGILPAALIQDYSAKMKEFAAKYEALIDSHFLAKWEEIVAWARQEHNGTFDASDYPEGSEIRRSFYFKTVPLPVPDSSHFSSTVSNLLGTDVESVDWRIKDATEEARKELMTRLIEPVRAMVAKLTEQPKVKKDGTQAEDIVFRDSLIGNIKQIAELAPALNITGDPAIDAFAQEVAGLGNYLPQTLRDDKATRAEAVKAAERVLSRLDGYQL